MQGGEVQFARVKETSLPAVSLTLNLAEFDGVVFDLDDLLIGTQQLSANPGFHLPLYGEAIEQLIGYELAQELKELLVSRIDRATSHELLPTILRTLSEWGVFGLSARSPEELGIMIEPYRRTKILEAAKRGECPLLPGAQELIFELSAQGKTLGIYTSNRRSINEPLIELVMSAELKALFPKPFILFGDEVVASGGKRKPDPFGFLEMSRRMNIAPVRLIAFDDACEGLQAGLDANYGSVIGVDGGKGSDFSSITCNPKLKFVRQLRGVHLV